MTPLDSRPTNITAELGEVHVPMVQGPIGSNLTWEGQLTQTTGALINSKSALRDRRPWVKWTARLLFLFIVVLPLLFFVSGILVAAISGE